MQYVLSKFMYYYHSDFEQIKNAFPYLSFRFNSMRSKFIERGESPPYLVAIALKFALEVSRAPSLAISWPKNKIVKIISTFIFK